MQIKRLRPEQGAAKAIIDASKKIKHLETRPAGTIVITDKLIARDPQTGVETILGYLPDGSFGLQPNINDTVPPNKPSTPKAEPALGAVSLTWDGKDYVGADQPRDFARTEVHYQKIGSNSSTLGGIFYDANTVLVSGLTSDVPYEFRLVSYDTNGNPSELSGRVTCTPANFVDNTDVADALADVRKEAQDATSASAAAQNAATEAQEAATAAAEEAARAAGLAANGSGVIFSETAPTDPKDRTDSKLWIDTSGTPAKNTPNRWDGGKWVAVTDKAALDAAAKATAAETAADLAAASAASAAGAAGEAQKAANGKNRVWYRDAAPAGNAHTVGDTWFDSANGNVPKVWTGAVWASAQDASIATAKSVADSALTTANGKNTVFYQTGEPASTTAKPLKQGDLWFDTDANYAQYTYTGSAWVKTQDSAAASKKADDANSRAEDALTAADGKATVRYAATAPSGTAYKVNDLWFDSANGNKPMRWDGAKWVSVADGAIKTALDTADGKSTAYWENTKPTGGTYKKGDTWFDTANNYALWTHNGSTWVKTQDAAEAQAEAERLAAVEAQRLANVALEAAKTDATTKVATKNKTWIQTSRPALTGNITGDTWIDTSTAGGNKLNVWNGSAWVAAQDTAIATAQGAAGAALTAANGKNKIVFNTTDATGTTGYTAGDLWMKRNPTTGIIIGQWEFTASNTWEKRTVGEEVIGNLSAGKITSGTISADRIGANTISVEKLLVTSIDNLVYDANHADRTGAAWTTGYSGAFAWDETGGRGGTPALKITLSATQQGRYNTTNTPVTGGASYRVLAWVFSTTEIPAKGLAIYARQRTTSGGTTYSTMSVTNNTPIPANAWFPFNEMLTLREDAVSASFGIYSQSNHTTGTLWIDYLSATRAANAELLVDGSIKAGSAIIADGAIGTAQIGQAQITTALIKDGQITNAKINDLNASKITAGTIAADRIDANTVRAKLIAADDINAADILVSGSITSASGVIGELDAGVITSGYINAARIQAGSLTIGAVQGLQSTVDAAAAANSTVTAWKGSDGKVNAANVTGTLAATVPGAKVSGAVPVDAVPALPTSKVTNLDSALTSASNTSSRVNGWTFAGTTEINGGSIRTDTITATQIKAASLTSASGVFGDINASSITSGTIAADRLVANDIRAKIIAADDINAGDIIASNSITATNGIIGSIDAAKITVGTLNAARIAAQSITADKVIIGQGTNLITDPAFVSTESNTVRATRSTGTWTFQTDLSTGIKSAKTTTATTNNAFHFGLMQASAANAANMIPAAPGEKYVFMASVHTSASAGVRWNVETVRADGSTAYLSAGPTNTATGRRALPAFEYVVPAGVVAFNPVLACLTTGVTWTVDGGAVCARKVEGSLIVDGAINGQTITGALIQSVSDANRGIKLNASQFVSYDNSGVETLRLDGSSAVITGATVQTATTGARVIMDKTGLRAFPATGAQPYLTASSSGLELTGTMKTTGSSTEAPGSVFTTIVGPTPVNGGIAAIETVPGVGFYSSSLASTTDSPPSVVSTDGIGLELRGRQQKMTDRLGGVVYIGDDANISLYGNVSVTGRVKQVVPNGRHMEWTGSLALARGSGAVPVTGLALDVDKSPGVTEANHSVLYNFATYSNGRLTFKEDGVYFVSIKGAMNSAPTATANIQIYEDGWSAQAGYVEPGWTQYATAGGFFYMKKDSYLTFTFGHNNASTVTVNFRLRVTAGT